MWKLTIHQSKAYDNFVGEEKIIFKSLSQQELLNIIGRLSDTEVDENTWFTLEYEEGEGEGRCSSEN